MTDRPARLRNVVRAFEESLGELSVPDEVRAEYVRLFREWVAVRAEHTPDDQLPTQQEWPAFVAEQAKAKGEIPRGRALIGQHIEVLRHWAERPPVGSNVIQLACQPAEVQLELVVVPPTANHSRALKSDSVEKTNT